MQSTFFLGCLSCISFGLLNNSFQLTNENRIAPHSAAAKGQLVAEAASVIQRSQKVPTERMSGCPTRQSLTLTYNSGRYRTLEAFRGRVLIRDAGQPAGIPQDVLTLRADLERRPWSFTELLWPKTQSGTAFGRQDFRAFFELCSAPGNQVSRASLAKMPEVGRRKGGHHDETKTAASFSLGGAP